MDLKQNERTRFLDKIDLTGDEPIILTEEIKEIVPVVNLDGVIADSASVVTKLKYGCVFNGCFYVILHYVKSVRIWSCSGLRFPAFGQNTGRYSVSQLQIRTPFTPY